MPRANPWLRLGCDPHGFGPAAGAYGAFTGVGGSDDRLSMAFAEAHGILGPRSVLVHTMWTGEGVYEPLVGTGTHVTLTPASNAKTGTGIGRIHGLLQVGVNVTLGCDSGPSNIYDMIRSMRQVSYLANLCESEPMVVPAESVLEIARINGAKAKRLEDEIGSLEPGKKEDFILISMDKPHLTLAPDPVSTIVYAGHCSDVDTVVIDGKMVMEFRTLFTLDEDRIVEEARWRFPEVMRRSELAIGLRWPVL